jgi:uroporphyrinogen-III synthase
VCQLERCNQVEAVEYDALMPKSKSKTIVQPFARLRTETGALAGASLVVTRPAGSGQNLKRQIRALGGTVLSLPGIALRADVGNAAAAKAALAAARTTDIAIFVSPAAVRFAFALRPGLRFARDTEVCAIGAATAGALARHNIRNVLWPRGQQNSEGLLALPQLQKLRGDRVVVIGAPGGRELLVQGLRARRARVSDIHVYRRMPPRLTRPQLAALEQAPVPLLTLLTSAEALQNLRATLPLHLFARMAAGELIVSSERLATLARASLFSHVHVALSALPRDLLEAARMVLARHRL